MGLKVERVANKCGGRASSNQTKMGLKDSHRRNLYIELEPGSNQTKMGLKVLDRTEHLQHQYKFKSDQNGIESL